MQRSLFDSAGRPKEKQPEATTAKPPEPRIFTVSQLNNEVKFLMESTFRSVWVEGEISNFTQPGSGHFYFSLKDAESQIKVVMWKSNQRVLRWRPKNGMKVMVSGKMMLYEPRGEYQIDVMQIVPHGKGDLYAAYEQLKEKLQAEGLFDAKRKRPIPMLPKRIGIVTSRSGAAIRDMLQILNRRYANLHILLFPAIVQGEEAATSIVEGIRALNRRKDIDVLIVGRGGGSLEDLWPFNEEIVARAIVASRIPVISAVGHETDTTISDFVADLRAPTPSAAAELVIAKKSELMERVMQLHKTTYSLMRARMLQFLNAAERLTQHRGMDAVPQRLRTFQQTLDDQSIRLRHGFNRTLQQQTNRHLQAQQQLGQAQLRHLIELKRSRLNELMASLATTARKLHRVQQDRVMQAGNKLQVSSLKHRMEVDRTRIANFIAAMNRALHAQTARGKQALAHGAGKLDSLSPLAVLERGYSIASREDGAILKDTSQTSAGDEIRVRLHRGKLKCRVTEVEHE